jgi:hypothetical protein
VTHLAAIARRLADGRQAAMRSMGVLTPDQQATAWELSAMRGGAWMARGPMSRGFGRRNGPGGPAPVFAADQFRATGRGGAREVPDAPLLPSVPAPDLLPKLGTDNESASAESLSFIDLRSCRIWMSGVLFYI